MYFIIIFYFDSSVITSTFEGPCRLNKNNIVKIHLKIFIAKHINFDQLTSSDFLILSHNSMDLTL